MALGSLNDALRRTLYRLHPAGVDGQLLERFAASQDQAAFAELVRRHGPMVLQVCRRVLGHHQDAEDAFQATFVVLARKAGTVAGLDSVGGWLHGVAYRTAMNARKLRGRRAVPTGTPVDAAAVGAAPGANLMQADLHTVLDEELARLPEKYRTPIVLCHLEGKTTEEAAQQLGWPSGTVKTQLFRGREVLRERLTRRGLTLGAGGVAAVLTEHAASAAVPGVLLQTTTQGAAALAGGAGTSKLITAPAAELAASLQQDLARRKIRWAAALLVLFAGAGVTLALAWPRSADRLPTREAGVQTVELPNPGQIGAAGFSTDGRRLALGDERTGAVTLYEVDYFPDRVALRKLPVRLDGPHTSMAFAPDGKTLAVGCLDGAVQVWDVAAGSKRTTLQSAHRGKVIDLKFRTDGQALAAMVHQGGITTWDLRSQAVQSRIDLPDYASGVYQAFTAQNDLFVINAAEGVGKGRARCWDAATGREKPIDFPQLPKVSDQEQKHRFGNVAALSADADMVVACNDGRIYLWRRQPNRMHYLFTLTPEERESPLTFLAGPPGDTVAILIRQTNRLVIWDVGSSKVLRRMERPFEGGFRCLAYSGDGTKFYWVGYDKPAKVGTSVTQVGGIIDLNIRRREVTK